ncbi:tripartite motif-containing protein 5-like [Ovis aries]|uniref:tripartite motif-containing protein 5-like n=1 Tax=Ovis aries TaxID=9940 RepID=UPI00295288D3|nr:tripartite motif-containing protein 5-like [Ovis aries]
MASGILMNIQEEVTCPICLELLSEPRSLDCGHTCQACITANNEESIIGQEGKKSCPVCRVSFEPGNLQPNRHVANIVQRLREVKVSPEVEQERNLCAHHGEKLQLFCEQDGKVICWLCERSQEHRGHNTFLMEEIAPQYQKMLQSCLQRLNGKKQEAEELEIKVREEMSTWKDVNVILKRSKTVALKEPKTFPKEQRRVFRAPDLREILCVFNELTDMQRYWVQVNPNSPKSTNVISPEQRQVRYASRYQHCNAYSNDNYEDFGVLGSPVITSGRHYWEVDVSKKRAWILGICGEQCKDIMKFLYGCENYGNRNCQKGYSRYQPKNGYWVIGLKQDSVYNAFESSFLGPGILTLSLGVSPHRVGVFLDYEARTVLFLNVTNHGFPIYKFSSCCFPQKIVPYFNPMNCDAPMTVCSPSC